MIYATKQSQPDGSISTNAMIAEFETRAQAEAWLLAGTAYVRPRIVAGTHCTRWRQVESRTEQKLDALIASLLMPVASSYR